MSDGIKVKLNGQGVGVLLKSEEVRAELTVRAHAVLSAAQEEARGYIVTGNFYDNLQIIQDTTDRAAVRIGSTSPHAHLVEAKHGTMAHALDAAR